MIKQMVGELFLVIATMCSGNSLCSIDLITIQRQGLPEIKAVIKVYKNNSYYSSKPTLTKKYEIFIKPGGYWLEVIK
jgi:hypothetical protein